MARVLVIVNDVDSGPGSLIRAMVRERIDIDVRIAETSGIPDPTELDDVAGLVLLGGGFMPTDEQKAPWLPAERALIRAARQRGTPLLGVCLGAQLIAHEAGGMVDADSGPAEKGSVLVSFDEARAQDPLLSTMPDEAPFIQNHVDRITRLPEGAVLLASSPTCRVQAFRLGERCWGTQFHPEADVGSVRRWSAEELTKSGWDKELLIAQAEADEPAMVEARDALFAAFAQLIRR